MANPRARGQQRDKPFLAALRLEIAEASDDPKRMRRIAKALLDKAESGDVTAIKELADRLDGKVPQALTGEDGGPIELSVLSSDELSQLEHILAAAAARTEPADGAGGDTPARRDPVSIPDNHRD